MTEQPIVSTLIEPSFADAIIRITAEATLPRAKRIHWPCSLRRVGEALGRPLDAIPARWSAIRWAAEQLHHVPLGIEAKTLSSHLSNVKAALSWFSPADDLTLYRSSLSPAWAALNAETSYDKHLSAFIRFCSANGFEPPTVHDASLERFMAYRGEHTRLKNGVAARRAVARAWNRRVDTVPGWPATRLIEPPLRRVLQLADLPPGLRVDLESYLGSLQQIRRDRNGRRCRPCKPSTIRTRRAELMAFTAKAIECGLPLEDLNSFAVLLQPEIVETVIDAYWRENGETPSIYTIKLASQLLDVARSTGALDEAGLERLADMRTELENYREPGLTEKNRALIRQVLVDEVWRAVMAAPELLMTEATCLHNSAPKRAAVLAELAVAVQILLFAPIRVGNLARIRIGENLIRSGGPSAPYWLVFPENDVKNRVPLEFELTAKTTKLIERYLAEFRPALTGSCRSDWLFPGENGNPKDTKTLSAQISERVRHASGVVLTPHQFRHAAAAILLKHRPGEYELVRRLLGHRSIETTQYFYAGLESLQATRIFGEMIEKELEERLTTTPKRRRSASRSRTTPPVSP
jgi:integrase